MSNDKNLELIANLLRKAERTENEHEASAFMERAQTLATRHSIDLAIARAHTARAEAREQVEEQRISIGDRGKNGLAMYVELFLAVANANDIRCLIASNSTAVFAMGFPSDIEVARALYASLLVQMVQAGDAYIKSGEYKKETVWQPGRYKKVKTWVDDGWGGYYEEDYVHVPGREKPMDGRVARRSFYQGFISRISARLRDAKIAAEEAAKAADAPVQATEDNPQALTSTALVLVEKKAEVAAFYGERSKGVGTWKGSKASSGTSSYNASRAGREAGDRARLTGQQSLPAGRGQISA